MGKPGGRRIKTFILQGNIKGTLPACSVGSRKTKQEVNKHEETGHNAEKLAKCACSATSG